jgi:Tfp pilus assembly protein PilP
MQGAHRLALTALLGLGITVVVRPFAAIAAPGDGALRGPVAAIAKARAAAEQAERRAAAHDAQAATAFADAPRGRAPQEPGADGAKTTAAESHGTVAPRGDAAAPKDEQARSDDAPSAPAPPTYDVTAHRDPFRPPRLTGTVDARTPLQTYQLGQLKLVGIVVESSQGYRAMVEDSAGLGYIITTGTPIGSSGGVVRSIEPRRVVIEESTRDFYGDMKPKEVVMELPQEDRSP